MERGGGSRIDLITLAQHFWLPTRRQGGGSGGGTADSTVGGTAGGTAGGTPMRDGVVHGTMGP